ncbi:uncharacterized protein NEMAJ01_1072 [Nematocida major]|uniref:uncharacterized protein n=1 Tax=Nematocida major TaxID=1912982 RepID=UPI002008D8EB|nr:uncharacterized protein NEMAJ01_1072 [Nematocida major]KAH9386176.1 hypothetical protein NEMAJ01_1072 [Nematocida major]
MTEAHGTLQRGRGPEYEALFQKTLEQERRYNDIEKKINNEIIRLLIVHHTELESNKQTLQAEIERLEHEKEARQAAEDVAKQREAETEEKEVQLKEAFKDKKDLEKKLAALQKSIEAVEKKALLETEAEKKRLAESEAMRKKEQELIKELEEKQEAVAMRERDLVRETERKNQEIEKAKNLSAEVEKTQSELAKKRKEIEEKELEISQLEKTLKEVRKTREAKEEETYEKERDLKRKIQDLEEKIKVFPECSSSAREEISQLKIESEISKAKVEEKNKTIEILQGTILRLESLFAKQMEYAMVSAPKPGFSPPPARPSEEKPEAPVEDHRAHAENKTVNTFEEPAPKPALEKKPKQPAQREKKEAPVRKRGKREVVDIKKEMSKQNLARETKKIQEALSDSEEDRKEKKDFSTLFGKKKTKNVFTGRPEASSFFANLSFSDYEPDTSEK